MIEYGIHTEGHPYLKETLEKCSKITRENELESNNYRKVENNSACTMEENMYALNYLNKMKKCTNKDIFIFFGLLSVPLFVGLFLYFNNKSIASIFAGVFSSICSLSVGMTSLIGAGTINMKSLGLARTIRRKIRNLKKKLSRVNTVANDETAISINRDALYRDSIIAYMNSIMKAANKLKPEDRKSKLLELRSILNEYIFRSQELNDDNEKGLTLSGGRRQIITDILDRLTTLEMEVADMLNRDSKNNSLFAENEKFMKELDDSIGKIEKNNEVMTSNGKVLTRKMK